jgi:site-specific DNA-methyltransferase (adenine-specific)
MIDLRHGDCMEYLATCEDNAFELAIVDPPYGIGMDGVGEAISTGKSKPKGNRLRKAYERKAWDQKPCAGYFQEVKRVAQDQIIWGANYFVEHLDNTRGWIVWDKVQRGLTYGDLEIAYTSFDRVPRAFNLHRSQLWKESPIHPTQKPVKLYEWLLMNYAKEGDRILDTHLGSGSIAIACHNLGFDLVGCELDEDYYKGACERLERHKAQLRMF